jgi:hypothetical protein
VKIARFVDAHRTHQVWWVTGNTNRSTRTAARVGEFIAFGLIALGVFSFFAGQGLGSLWLAFNRNSAKSPDVQGGESAGILGLHAGEDVNAALPDLVPSFCAD